MELYACVYHSLFTGWRWTISDEHDRIVAKGYAKNITAATDDCHREFNARAVYPPMRNSRSETFTSDGSRTKACVQVNVWRHAGRLYGMAAYSASRSCAVVMRKYTDAQSAWADMRQVAADLLG